MDPFLVTVTLLVNISSVPIDVCWSKNPKAPCEPFLDARLTVTDSRYRVVAVNTRPPMIMKGRPTMNITFVEYVNNSQIPLLLRLMPTVTISCSGGSDCRQLSSVGNATGQTKLPEFTNSTAHTEVQMSFDDVNGNIFNLSAVMLIDASRLTEEIECEDSLSCYESVSTTTVTSSVETPSTINPETANPTVCTTAGISASNVDKSVSTAVSAQVGSETVYFGVLITFQIFTISLVAAMLWWMCYRLNFRGKLQQKKERQKPTTAVRPHLNQEAAAVV